MLKQTIWPRRFKGDLGMVEYLSCSVFLTRESMKHWFHLKLLRCYFTRHLTVLYLVLEVCFCTDLELFHAHVATTLGMLSLISVMLFAHQQTTMFD